MAAETLYISDLDGTLLNSGKKLSRYAITNLNILMENGLHFTIATARTTATAVKILSGLNVNVPAVFMNGAVIYDITAGKYVKREAMSRRAMDSVCEVMREHGIPGFIYAIYDDALVTYYESLSSKAMKDFHDERVANYRKNFRQIDDFGNIGRSSEIVYICMIDGFERLSQASCLLRELPDTDAVLYRDIYSDNTWYLEVYSVNASKYNAVRYLREYGGYREVVGFGDNLNDIPLFKACDRCYAVSNAVGELKCAATGIIGDNNSDGVVRFLEEKHVK